MSQLNALSTKVLVSAIMFAASLTKDFDKIAFTNDVADYIMIHSKSLDDVQAMADFLNEVTDDFQAQAEGIAVSSTKHPDEWEQTAKSTRI